MAEFEGKLSLNVETSEIEVSGKFKLTEEELEIVAGGGPAIARIQELGESRDVPAGDDKRFRGNVNEITDFIIGIGYERETFDVIEEVNPNR